MSMFKLPNIEMNEKTSGLMERDIVEISNYITLLWAKKWLDIRNKLADIPVNIVLAFNPVSWGVWPGINYSANILVELV